MRRRASTHDDRIAPFSNYGDESVDAFAPGEGIHSTMRTGGYDYKQGTSMATAHVSGTAALVLQANSNLNTKQLKEVLLASADVDPAAPFAESVAGGRLDAYAAVYLAPTGPPTIPDTDGDGWVDQADACPGSCPVPRRWLRQRPRLGSDPRRDRQLRRRPERGPGELG